MSIQSQINRIKASVAAAYSAANDMGATLPNTQNVDNLADTVRTIRGLTFTNVAVAAGVFAADSTYSEFPFRAAIALPGVTVAMTPDVVFANDEAISGKFSPVSESYNGGVYIYATSAESITIPTIYLLR